MDQPAPRTIRFVLGLFLSAGLVLRLWGLRWGLDLEQSLHPDEWPFIVIYQISQGDFSEIGRSVWYNTYHLFSALVALVLRKGVYLVGLLFNLYRLEAEVQLDYIFIGRLSSALLGTLTIYLVYRTGRLLFNNPLLGLLAALIMTIAPLNVVQTHYLETDVPLAFMAILCFLGAYAILKKPGKASFFLGGLLYGLTFSTKPNGLLLALPFLVVLVYLLRERAAGMGIQALVPKIFLLFLATILGILLGAPGLVLNFSEVITPMVSFVWNLSQIKPQAWTGIWLEGPQASRFGWALHFLQEGFGLPWMILAALGVLYFMYRREREGLLLLSFPVGYFFIVGLWGRRFGERDLTVLLPFLSLLAAALLVRAFAPEGRGRLRAWGGVILVLGLSITPLWKSIQLDYHYWQADNRVLARQWIDRNIPPGSILSVDGYAPKNGEFPLEALDYSLPPEAYQQQVDYLVTSSMDIDRFFSIITGRTNDPTGRHVLALQQKFQLIKEFDLNFRNPAAKENGRFNFPDFVNPLIRVYATRAGAIRDPLFFPRLAASSRENYTLTFTRQSAYEKDTGAFFIPPGQAVKRVLRTAGPLKKILLILSNGPQTKTELSVSSGRRSARLELHPREVKTVLFKPARSFPYIRNLYALELCAQGHGNLWGQLVTDPLGIGVHLLQDGKAQEALPFLREAAAGQPDRLECRAFLASALAALGEPAAARKSFQEIEDRDPAFWSRHLALGRSTRPYAEWLKEFARATGYHYPLLRQSTQYRHLLPPEVRFFTLQGKQEVQGENFVAASEPEPDGTPAIKLWSRELFPRGSFRAVFKIKFFAPPRGDLRLDVLKHAHEGLVPVGEKKIPEEKIFLGPDQVAEFIVPFDNPVFGGNCEFRVFSLDRKTEFTLQEVAVSLDLRQALRQNLDLFQTAREKVFGPEAIRAGFNKREGE